MSFTERLTGTIVDLISYAENKKLISHEDFYYYLNAFLDVFKEDAPAFSDTFDCNTTETAGQSLKTLCDLAVEKGIISDFSYSRDLFSTRLMGILTPSPSEVRNNFFDSYRNGTPEKATTEFYQLCKDVDYIKTDAISKNIRYFANTECGELEITINLSKPEKDPREIAKLKNAVSVGYPKCMLCIENSGYAGRDNFPARQNHRIIPLDLAGTRSYLQYSPYAYYNEHCIVFNQKHVPMKIDRDTFEKMFSFVEQFPHYFIGSNADLPIVGGSILNHDHFQGGRYSFPMDKAPVSLNVYGNKNNIHISVLEWPMTTLCLEGTEKKDIIDLAVRILDAWREWKDASCDILPYTDDIPHNTITPILRKNESQWKLFLVLRNNRTNEQHPLGIFHPHAGLHHIKKENIGLIEVMGLFILPGRLKSETENLIPYLAGEKDMSNIDPDSALYKHREWMMEIISRYGSKVSENDSEQIIRREIAAVCTQVLKDAGVYKQTQDGKNGLIRFLNSIDLEVEKH